jgi:hypothetical protein
MQNADHPSYGPGNLPEFVLLTPHLRQNMSPDAAHPLESHHFKPTLFQRGTVSRMLLKRAMIVWRAEPSSCYTLAKVRDGGRTIAFVNTSRMVTESLSG